MPVSASLISRRPATHGSLSHLPSAYAARPPAPTSRFSAVLRLVRPPSPLPLFRSFLTCVHPAVAPLVRLRLRVCMVLLFLPCSLVFRFSRTTSLLLFVGPTADALTSAHVFLVLRPCVVNAGEGAGGFFFSCVCVCGCVCVVADRLVERSQALMAYVGCAEVAPFRLSLSAHSTFSACLTVTRKELLELRVCAYVCACVSVYLRLCPPTHSLSFGAAADTVAAVWHLLYVSHRGLVMCRSSFWWFVFPPLSPSPACSLSPSS